jgi:DNA polymerase/3'-5' exonuclease PolX
MADVDNWGLIFAIRTGSAAFSHHVLAAGWVRLGYHSAEGRLWKDGTIIPVWEERELFTLLGMPWVAPEAREV